MIVRIALATVALVLVSAPADAAVDVRVAPKFSACVYEDGSGGPTPCVWDAKHQGNGVGRSYIVWSGDTVRHAADIEYVSHRRAHRLTR